MKEIGPFRLGNRGRWCSRRRPASALCGQQLSKWFDVDEDKPLWVRIHKRPGKDRLTILGNAGNVGLQAVGRTGTIHRIFMYSGWLSHPPATYPYYVELGQ